MRKRPAESVVAREVPPTSCTTTLESVSPPRASTTEPRTSAAGWAYNTPASNSRAIFFTGNDDSNLRPQHPFRYPSRAIGAKVLEEGAGRPGLVRFCAKSPMTPPLPAVLLPRNAFVMQSRHEHRRSCAGAACDRGYRVDCVPAKPAWTARQSGTYDDQPAYGGPPRKRRRRSARQAPIAARQLVSPLQSRAVSKRHPDLS